MKIKDIIEIVSTEEALQDVLKEHNIKNVKEIAEHIMSFMLKSNICNVEIKKAYNKELRRIKEKEKKNEH